MKVGLLPHFRSSNTKRRIFNIDPKALESQFKSKPESVRAFLLIITQQATQILQLKLLILVTQNQEAMHSNCGLLPLVGYQQLVVIFIPWPLEPRGLILRSKMEV